MSYQSCILAVLAVVFTGGAVTLTTVATLTLSAITLGFGAMTIGSPVVAGMGSVAWAGAWSIAGLLVARHLGYHGYELEGTWGASGAIASAFLLWWLAGRLRVEGASGKDRSVLGVSDSDRLAPSPDGRGHGGGRVGGRPAGFGVRARGREQRRGARVVGDVRGGRRPDGRRGAARPARAPMAGGVAGLPGPGVDCRRLHRLPDGLPDVNVRRRGDPDLAGLHRPGTLRGAGAAPGTGILRPADAVFLAHPADVAAAATARDGECGTR